jgi:hypothetical protein
MGEVYLARDDRPDATWPSRSCHPWLAGHEESRQCFEREARTISRLNHPNICSSTMQGAIGTSITW